MKVKSFLTMDKKWTLFKLIFSLNTVEKGYQDLSLEHRGVDGICNFTKIYLVKASLYYVNGLTLGF